MISPLDFINYLFFPAMKQEGGMLPEILDAGDGAQDHAGKIDYNFRRRALLKNPKHKSKTDTHIMKTEKITQKLSLTAAAMLLPMSAGAWTLIDDFQGYTGGAVPSYQILSSAEYQQHIYSETDNPTNFAWYIDWVFVPVGGGQGDTRVSIPLPAEIPADEAGTIYFRYLREGFSHNVHFGTSDLDSTAAWADNNAIIRLNESMFIDAHSGTYIPAIPELTPGLNEWHQFWLVVRNASVEAEQTYSVHYQGPADTEPTLLEFYASATSNISNLVFRRKATGPIKIFTVTINAGDPANDRDVFLIDDIYFSPGENTGNPLAVTLWCGNEPSEGWVDSGERMGWLYVTEQPWIYSDAFGLWMYVPECPDDVGGWYYILKDEEPDGISAWCSDPSSANVVDTGDWLGLFSVGNQPYLYNHTHAQWIYSHECPSDADGAWFFIYSN